MRHISISDIGYHRKKNQDSYCCVYNQNQDFLVLVCDGIGGNKAGEVASAEVVRYFQEVFSKNYGFLNLLEARHYFREHIQKVNSHIARLSNSNNEYEGMGTTLTGLFFCEFGTLILNIGDSRCYGISNHKMTILTEDDSLVAEMLRMGEITIEESLTHPKRHFLTKALGIWPQIDVRIDEAEKFDWYLVCSDGLHGYVSEEEMLLLIDDENLSLTEKAEKLKEAALQKGGYDNITFVLLEELWQK